MVAFTFFPLQSCWVDSPKNVCLISKEKIQVMQWNVLKWITSRPTLLVVLVLWINVCGCFSPSDLRVLVMAISQFHWSLLLSTATAEIYHRTVLCCPSFLWPSANPLIFCICNYTSCLLLQSVHFRCFFKSSVQYICSVLCNTASDTRISLAVRGRNTEHKWYRTVS